MYENVERTADVLPTRLSSFPSLPYVITNREDLYSGVDSVSQFLDSMTCPDR